MLPTTLQRNGNPGEIEYVGATSGNVAAAAAVATIAADNAKRAFLTGFEITGGGATAASVVLATVTGLASGTKTFAIAVPAGVTLGIVPLVVPLPVPLPAVNSATNIVITLPSLGAGNTNACVNAHGFKLPLGP